MRIKRLVCERCKTNSIPAPAGATAETRYVCPECSDCGTAEGAQLDRCQFDKFKINPEKSEFPQGLLKTASKVGWVVAHSDLSRLPEQQEFIYFMRIWLGLRPKQVAKYLRISVNSVNAQLSRAKHSLRVPVTELRKKSTQ